MYLGTDRSTVDDMKGSPQKLSRHPPLAPSRPAERMKDTFSLMSRQAGARTLLAPRHAWILGRTSVRQSSFWLGSRVKQISETSGLTMAGFRRMSNSSCVLNIERHTWNHVIWPNARSENCRLTLRKSTGPTRTTSGG